MSAMPIARIDHHDGPRLGVVLNDDELALIDMGLRADQGAELLLAEGRRTAERRIDSAVRSGPRVPLRGARLTAPIPRPPKVFAIGLNYKDHIAESGMPAPEVPTVFAKFVNSVCGPSDAIQRPKCPRSSTTRASSEW